MSFFFRNARLTETLTGSVLQRLLCYMPQARECTSRLGHQGRNHQIDPLDLASYTACHSSQTNACPVPLQSTLLFMKQLLPRLPSGVYTSTPIRCRRDGCQRVAELWHCMCHNACWRWNGQSWHKNMIPVMLSCPLATQTNPVFFSLHPVQCYQAGHTALD